MAGSGGLGGKCRGRRRDGFLGVLAASLGQNPQAGYGPINRATLTYPDADGGTVNDDVTITQERSDGSAVVTVRGEIDVASAPQLRGHLHELCTEEITDITVDLREVTFLDSSALGVLVGALRRCRESGTGFRLIINSPRLLKIFEITGLTSVFEISETLDGRR